LGRLQQQHLGCLFPGAAGCEGGAVIVSGKTEAGGPRPAAWRIAVAFGIVYLGYGLNFLAIKAGVESLPAFLFAASHILGAGLILAVWTAARGGTVWMPVANLGRAAFAAFFLFVGGVGLVTQGEKLGVPSGVAAIIKASVPLWVALLEGLRPRGERPARLAVAGLLGGASGVALLVLPRLDGAGGGGQAVGTALLLLSALLFAIGSIFVRHHAPDADPVRGSMWMMLFGGGYLVLLGGALGEFGQVSAEDFGPRAVSAFLFLLFVHSLAAFTAMNWLLRHLPASIVTTKFFVSPAIAVVAGWLAMGEAVGVQTVASLGLILSGVAVVFFGQGQAKKKKGLADDAAEEV
jgi:drug/metabolite transporter (DMT)-like permease